MGSYINQDPIGLMGGNNHYIYPVNPTGWIDSLGLQQAYVVNFPDYPVEYAEGKTSTWLGGHSGVLTYDTSVKTQYFEYGIYIPNAKGIIGSKLPQDDGQEMPPKQVNNFMKINKSFILIIALILVIIYLAYSVVDKSITLSYSNQGCESSRADIDNVISLIEREWRGMNMEQIAYKLKNSSINKKAVNPQIKMENDLIWYGDVRFIFSSGRLVKVEY